MQAEIIRGDDLKREVWRFRMNTNWSACADLFLDSYSKQSRPTKRHGWRTWDCWSRLERTRKPPLPPDVVQEAKDTFKAQIDKLEVTR